MSAKTIGRKARSGATWIYGQTVYDYHILCPYDDFLYKGFSGVLF